MGQTHASYYSSNDLSKAVTGVDATVVIDGAQRSDVFHGDTKEHGSLLLSTDNNDELEKVMGFEEDGNDFMGNTDDDQYNKETDDEELLDDDQGGNTEDTKKLVEQNPNENDTITKKKALSYPSNRETTTFRCPAPPPSAVVQQQVGNKYLTLDKQKQQHRQHQLLEIHNDLLINYQFLSLFLVYFANFTKDRSIFVVSLPLFLHVCFVLFRLLFVTGYM
eukprot:CAMPEP_0194449864 /NCGR_PEP_ID=MMETSP0176-20130528/130392_1 /TAXON_ID=216777 /ORGANISM="Proboscia alata, Strain PI-D3" /LENGTH=219 /DNA_ID=CAMNT_0039277059 /DNA_START=67 /DNA_END=726 /DNA_ORIENTATION=+